MADVSEEAVKRRAAEQLSGATADMVTQGNIEVRRGTCAGDWTLALLFFERNASGAANVS